MCRFNIWSNDMETLRSNSGFLKLHLWYSPVINLSVKRMLFRLIILAAAVTWSGSLKAASRVDATVDTSSILIGDPLQLILTASTGPGETVRFPDVANNLGKFELLSSSEIERVESDDGSTVQRRRCRVTTYEIGWLAIPPLRFVSMGADGSVDTLFTPEIDIQVASLLSDSTATEVQPLKALVPAAKLWHRIALWTAAILLLVVLPLIYAWRRYLARRAAKLLEAAMPLTPGRPAHLVAFDELDRIKSLGLIEKGRIKLFHELVSASIRTFIAARFRVDSLEMTTWEVMIALENKLTGESLLYERFRDFLEACDLVKFAKYKPPLVEINSVFNLAYDLVESTRSIEADKPAQPEAGSLENDGSTDDSGEAAQTVAVENDSGEDK
jgi:hypothetical protein